MRPESQKKIDAALLLPRLQQAPRLRKIYQEEGEYQFEQEIKDFPIYVHCPNISIMFTKSVTAMIDHIDEMQEWCAEQFEPGTYLAFPTSAMGKYAQQANGTFFKYKSDAILFKLRWIGFDN